MDLQHKIIDVEHNGEIVEAEVEYQTWNEPDGFGGMVPKFEIITFATDADVHEDDVFKALAEDLAKNDYDEDEEGYYAD